jgi:hypothetical protein
MERLPMLVLAAALAMHPAVPAVRQAPAASRGDVIDRIMAVVGAQPIMLSDVQAAMLFGFIPPAPPGTADAVGYGMERLIGRTLILVEVERYQPPEPAPESIAARLADIQQKFPSSQAFDSALKDTGLTVDQLRREIRDDLRMQTYLNQRFGTEDSSTRTRLQSEWLASLRRRTEVTVLYLGK